MPIYVYETIPARAGEKPAYYEIPQRMADEPLATHPQTGERIRRVILGGFGVLSSIGRKGSTGRKSNGCGPGYCCG
jgi:predicted nucleic acid-binding Zn ribbon protein